MTQKVYTRGTLGHAPINGKYYFVHRESRMVRSVDMQTLPPTEGWEQVSLEQWEAFRKETKKLGYAEQAKLRRMYQCSSTTKSASPKSSTSKATSTKPNGKKSSCSVGQSCSVCSQKSKHPSKQNSKKPVAKPQAKSVASSQQRPTKRQSTQNGSN